MSKFNWRNVADTIRCERERIRSAYSPSPQAQHCIPRALSHEVPWQPKKKQWPGVTDLFLQNEVKLTAMHFNLKVFTVYLIRSTFECCLSMWNSQALHTVTVSVLTRYKALVIQCPKGQCQHHQPMTWCVSVWTSDNPLNLEEFPWCYLLMQHQVKLWKCLWQFISSGAQ